MPLQGQLFPSLSSRPRSHGVRGQRTQMLPLFFGLEAIINLYRFFSCHFFFLLWLRSINFSFFRHPQLLVTPERMSDLAMTTLLPQSHWHSQYSLCPSKYCLLIATSLPYLCPVISMKGLHIILKLVGVPRFERGLRQPECRVLPLHNTPIRFTPRRARLRS